MSKEEKYQLIDKFIQNNISAEELRELQQLKEDPVFQEEYQYRLELSEAIKIEGRQAIKSQFSKLDSHTPKIKKLIPVNIIRTVAAVGIVLLGAYFLMKPSGDLTSNDQLFASYYDKMPNKVALISRGEEIQEDSLKLAMISYNAGRYDETLKIFDVIESQIQILTSIGELSLWKEMKIKKRSKSSAR